MDALATFETLLGRPAYNWQRRLYAALHAGDVPSGLPLPTGLGKMSAVLLYLLTLAVGAPLPVRPAYLVDRRAIVDQTAATVRRRHRRRTPHLCPAIEPLLRTIER